MPPDLIFFFCENFCVKELLLGRYKWFEMVTELDTNTSVNKPFIKSKQVRQISGCNEFFKKNRKW